MFCMQKILLFSILLITSLSIVHAQSLPSNTCGLVYTYDAAGNLTQRKYICNNGSPEGRIAISPAEMETVQQVTSLYPNPTTGSFRLTFTKALKTARVSILDMNGRSLKQFNASGNEVVFDVSAYPSGLYYVNVIDVGNSMTFKVIKD